MTEDGSKIVVQSIVADYFEGRSVIIGAKNRATGRFAYVKGPMVMTELPPAELIAEPTIGRDMGTEFLQAALDHAWAIGLRPQNWKNDTTDEVAAVKAHLSDMRALVFDRDLKPRSNEQ
jgi:hypothetical protein